MDNLTESFKTKEGKNIYRGISDFPKETENPFLPRVRDDVTIHTVKKYKLAGGTSMSAIQLTIDPKTGEQTGASTFMRRIEVDDKEFTKIFRSEVTRFFNVGKQGNRVFGYIQSILKPGTDRIFFDMDEVLKFTGYTGKNNVYLGLRQLIEAEIISRSKHDTVYYINAMIFFNGNRLAFMKEYVKVENDKIKNQLTIDG